jgi:hypothetical protein
LIAFLVVISVRGWRRPVIRITAVTTLVAAIFSLGPRLTVGGVVHRSIPLPWALVQDAPFFKNVLPARFSVYVMMGAAVLVAMQLSELIALRVRWVPATLLMLALIPLVPVARHPDEPLERTPAFFTGEARHIAPGSVLVVEPYAHPGNTSPMVWQMRAGSRFAMPGGYVITQSAGRPTGFWPPSTPLRNTSILIEKGEPPRLTDKLREMLTTEIGDLGACAIVIGPHPHRTAAVSFFVELLRTTPRWSGGVWVFDLKSCGLHKPELDLF